MEWLGRRITVLPGQPASFGLLGIKADIEVVAFEEILDTFQGMGLGADNEKRARQQVFHERLNLVRGPAGKLEKAELLLDGCSQVFHRPGIQLERFGQRGIPTPTGAVDGFRLGQFVQIPIQGRRLNGTACGGKLSAHRSNAEIRCLGRQLAENLGSQQLLHPHVGALCPVKWGWCRLAAFGLLAHITFAPPRAPSGQKSAGQW